PEIEGAGGGVGPIERFVQGAPVRLFDGAGGEGAQERAVRVGGQALAERTQRDGPALGVVSRQGRGEIQEGVAGQLLGGRRQVLGGLAPAPRGEVTTSAVQVDEGVRVVGGASVAQLGDAEGGRAQGA